MRIVCISDTHQQHFDLKLPGGDVLIHAGDATGLGQDKPLRKFGRWLAEQPHKHKVVIAGNHDLGLEKNPHTAAIYFQGEGVHYLCESGVTIDGVKFWGSPYSPRFLDWGYQCDRGDDCAARWAKIPEDTDVLVVHGPPYECGDACPDMFDREKTVNVGCQALRERIDIVRPKLVVCGHIHEGYGMYKTPGGITVINASSVDGHYRLVNAPVEFEVHAVEREGHEAKEHAAPAHPGSGSEVA